MIRLNIDENTYVLVDVEPSNNFQIKGKDKKVSARLKELVNIIKSLGTEFNNTMSGISKPIKQFELSIGFEINAEGNFIISKYGAKAQIQGKFIWLNDKNED